MAKIVRLDGVEHRFPDGTTDEEVRAALQGDAPAANNGPRPGFMPPSLMLRATRAGSRFLPAALGAAGGAGGAALGASSGPASPLLAPILGLAGAQQGGELGEVLRQLVMNEPLNSGAVGVQGVTQGLNELLGLGVSGIAGSIGRKLMIGSLDRGAIRAAEKRFPGVNIPEVQARERVNTSPRGRGELWGRQGESVGALTGSIAAAEKGGMKRTLDQVAAPLIRAAEGAEGRALTRAERGRLEAKVRMLMNEAVGERSFGVVNREPVIPARPASKILTPQGQPATPARPAMRPKVPYRPTEEQAAKQVLARKPKTQTAFGAEQQSRAVAANPELARELAAAERVGLEQIPGVGGLNERTKQLMALRLVIEDALSRGPIRAHPLRMRAGPLGLDLLTGIADPSIDISRRLMSGTGLALTHPAFREATRQFPRFLEALIHDQGGAQ